MNSFIVFIIFVGTFFTVTYSFRLGAFLFLKNLGLKRAVSFGERLGMLAPMRGLFIISVKAGRAIV